MRLLLAFILLISVHLAMDAQVLSDSKSIPNFTGVWVWDSKKGGPMIAGLVPLQESNKSRTATNFTMTIEHNEPSMRVKSLVAVQGHETFETNALFFTDRRKVEAFGKLDSDNFRTASWHGRKLEEEIHGILQKEQTKGMDKVFKDKDTYRLKTVRTYQLSKDEKTLTLTVSTINVGSLPIKIEYKLVFNRQT